MQIQDEVFEILKELSGLSKVERTDRLLEELSLDSLTMVTLLVELEDKFNIELEESDMNPFDFKTVNDIIQLITKYRGENQ